MREWVLRIVAPDMWVTANYPKSRWARGPLVAAWRRASYQAAQAAKLPKGLARVRIEPVAHFRGRPPVREAPNLSSTIKAVVDGLGPEDRGKTAGGTPWIAPGYGLVPDDDDKHVELVQTVIGKPLAPKPYAPVGELVLTISEVCDAK